MLYKSDNQIYVFANNKYYKLTKKRVFLNSPLHHHFEKLGYQEPDIVKAFWLFGILCSLAGIYFAVWL